MADNRRYLAYMLRAWLEEAGDEAQDEWRFRLQNVRTGEEWGFTTLEAVMALLEQEIAPVSDERSSTSKP